MAKYEHIIDYILELKAGTKISVRSIASELNVSEGTAYRAIKDCCNNGYVSTIPRIGTVRVDKVEKKNVNYVTFADVVKILGGSILAGKNGIYKTFNKTVIGAMTIDAMKEYISEGDLLITGNRDDVHELSLKIGAGIIISGGFLCSNYIKSLADSKELPVISSKYDTFTTATIINKIVSDNLIKKDIILVEDIMNYEPVYFKISEKICDVFKSLENKKIEMFPIVDEDNKVFAIVNSKDVYINKTSEDTILKLGNKNFTQITKKTTISYLSHIMSAGREEIYPVVENKKLVGTIQSNDVINILENNNRNFQNSETLEETIRKYFSSFYEDESLTLVGKIPPEMVDDFGSTSWGILNMIYTISAVELIKKLDSINASIDSISTFFMKPVEIGTIICVHATILDINNNFCKVEVQVYDENKKNTLGKALVSSKILKN